MTANTTSRLITYTTIAVLLMFLPVPGRADQPVAGFVQQVQHARLYMTHYALFEEPDPGILPGIYIDAATGKPTDQMTLSTPFESFAFAPDTANGDYVVASYKAVKELPYGVSPPGFPPLSAPDSMLAAISNVLGGAVPYSVLQNNTNILLVAIGHFEPTGTPVNATLNGDSFSVTRDVEFQVRVRVGFIFQPPAGYAVPPVGIVTWLTRGLVDLLINSPVDSHTENEIVVYKWRAAMTLSTENSYIRPIASEPRTVADGWPDGVDTIRFIGQPVDSAGRYTIVGHATHVAFEAPPELEQFLFGTTQLTDIEFAIEESGVLTTPDPAPCSQADSTGIPASIPELMRSQGPRCDWQSLCGMNP